MSLISRNGPIHQKNSITLLALYAARSMCRMHQEAGLGIEMEIRGESPCFAVKCISISGKHRGTAHEHFHITGSTATIASDQQYHRTQARSQVSLGLQRQRHGSLHAPRT